MKHACKKRPLESNASSDKFGPQARPRTHHSLADVMHAEAQTTSKPDARTTAKGVTARAGPGKAVHNKITAGATVPLRAALKRHAHTKRLEAPGMGTPTSAAIC